MLDGRTDFAQLVKTYGEAADWVADNDKHLPPPVVFADGVMYSLGSDGIMYAIK